MTPTTVTFDALERDRRADEVGIGREVAAPEPFADDDDRRAGGRLIALEERATDEWSSAEHVEEVRRRAKTAQPLRLGDVAEVAADRHVAGEAGEDSRLLTPLEVVRGRDGSGGRLPLRPARRSRRP